MLQPWLLHGLFNKGSWRLLAEKICYIYRLEAGYSYKEKPEVVEFFYAPNSKRLVKYAQNMFHDKKYNKYRTIKVGISNTWQEMRMISDFESWSLKQSMMADAYAERIERK